MGAAWEIVDTFVTNPGAAPVATTLFPGDVSIVRNFDSPARAWLVQMYSQGATEGIARLRSPHLHDNVQGIRVRNFPAVNRGLLSGDYLQQLTPNDALIAELSGGGAETDGLGWIVYYEDLPGISGQFFTADAIAPRVKNLVNIEVDNANGAAVGARSAGRALNADFDLLKSDTQYAILGYESDAVGLSVGIRGVDTGNLRIGGPMTTERAFSRDYFVQMSKMTGFPMIPVISANNKSAILVDNAQVVAGIAANIVLVCAELSS